MFTIKNWKFKTKSLAYMKSSTFREKAKYGKVSIISIVLGLIVGMAFISFFGINGVGFIFTSLVAPFNSAIGFDKTVMLFSVYLLLGLGLSLGFRVKLFNMGGSGQALAGLFISYIVLNAIAQDPNFDFSQIGAGYGVLIFILFMLVGAFVSSLTGILKICFNIHEVATSIVINWIIWYLLKYYIFIKFGAQITSPNLPDLFGEGMWIVALVFALISVVVVFVVCERTTIGYKYKIVGTQPTAAKYAGIKSPFYIIAVTALQGVFISAAGFFYYFGLEGSLNVSSDIMPLLGFDGIPIALVAFNNFLGIVPVALLWAFLKDGIELTMSSPNYMGLPSETSDLLFGIMIYFSAMYLVFMHVNITVFMRKVVFLFKNQKQKIDYLDKSFEIKKLRMKIWKVNKDKELVNLKNEISILKSSNKSEEYNEKISSLEFDYKELKHFKKKKLKARIKELKDLRNNSLDTSYNEFRNKTIPGLKQMYEKAYGSITFPILDEVVRIDNEIETLKQSSRNSEIDYTKLGGLQESAIRKITDQKQQIKELKLKYKELKAEAKKYVKEVKKQEKAEIKLAKAEWSKQGLSLKIKKIKEESLMKVMEVTTIYGITN